MRIFFALIFCLFGVTGMAQSFQSKIQIHRSYIPEFTVQEASDMNVNVWGLRWMVSDYDLTPFEFGVHAYGGYGNVSRVSFGLNLAYFLMEQGVHDIKIGVGLSKIYLKDVDINPNVIGPQVGDVSFTGWGNQFKPYIEWEWEFSRFSSFFIQIGYHIINGDKSEVTSVEATQDTIVKTRITGRKETFFYSASGFEFGAGLSINF